MRRRATAHCDVSPIHWSQYLDGEFSSVKCRQCEEHLARCVACRAKLRDVRKTVKACRTAARQPVPATVRAAMRRRARAIVGA